VSVNAELTYGGRMFENDSDISRNILLGSYKWCLKKIGSTKLEEPII
jgi:hypothetical protein